MYARVGYSMSKYDKVEQKFVDRQSFDDFSTMIGVHTIGWMLFIPKANKLFSKTLFYFSSMFGMHPMMQM